MNRRGFLGTLLASIGALAIDPATLLWHPPAVSEGLPQLLPEALVGLRAITSAMARELATRWSPTAVPVSRLGEGGLTHQFYVEMASAEEIDQYGLDQERYLVPAAAAMAMRLDDVRARRCGALQPPPGIESAVAWSEGVSVRGCLAYNPVWGQHRLRFDVVSG